MRDLRQERTPSTDFIGGATAHHCRFERLRLRRVLLRGFPRVIDAPQTRPADL